MTKIKTYWKGLAELNQKPLVEKLKQNEFVEEIPVDDFLSDKKLPSSSTSRRDFLKFLGFSTAAATLASCEAPVVKSIPYVNKPEEIVPGIANYYATTMYDGHDYASILVKTREGRPIKIESNKTCTNARVQASVLSLYDSGRLREPIKNNNIIGYSTLDSEIKNELSRISKEDGNIVILTPTLLSPSTRELISLFSSKYKNVKHIQLDSVSSHGILEANKLSFGLRALPMYHFDKAKVIVSFGADFIGGWGHPNYEGDYIKGRNPKNKTMSKHYQIESTLTLTGSNACERLQIKPSEQKGLISDLYKFINCIITEDPISGEELYTYKSQTFSPDPRIIKLAKELKQNKGNSVVVCNSNDIETQVIVNAINNFLENYDNTLTLSKPSYLKQGNDDEINTLISDMNNGKINALITHNVNPSYTLQNGADYDKGLRKVNLKISTSLYNDESASQMTYCIPDNHYLESWGDANPTFGQYSLMQPTIKQLFNGRQFQDSLMLWTGLSQGYHKFLKDFYVNKNWDINWDKVLHNGYFTKNIDFDSPNYKNADGFDSFLEDINKSNFIEFEMAEKISMGDGSQSNNPWLQELPDPLSRACWDNYLTMSAATARKLGVKNWNVSNGALNGSVVTLTVNGLTYTNVPVMIQPGQAKDTVSMAIGYGRTAAGKCGNNIGFNAFKLGNGQAKIKLIDGEHEFAATQLHHTMMGRDIVKETTLADYILDPSSGNKQVKYLTHEGKQPAHKVTLWDDHDHTTGHFWNQSIDLSLCTGCAACVIACHAENNVPVVGKEEIRKSRDMHWLRIDRYFSSDMTKEKAADENVSTLDMYSEMEDPSANPEVVFQPVMCQHCNHAPCETVCPVAATTHSAEGLNHMTYNRCIGTRYCANNCPYKVRRFNWFKYNENDKFDFNMNDDYGKMVLNPDVVVRSRGVIEKCSMCIQMIQAIKLKAKMTGKPVADEDVQTACSSACSTGAMVFGDANNETHSVHKLKKDERMYSLLEHLNTAPSVFYQTKIRNKS